MLIGFSKLRAIENLTLGVVGAHLYGSFTHSVTFRKTVDFTAISFDTSIESKYCVLFYKFFLESTELKDGRLRRGALEGPLSGDTFVMFL